MKKRNSVLIFGISSILILISVQLFLILGIWKEKGQMVDLRYKTLSQEATEELNKLKNTDGFDTAIFIIDKYAEDIITNEIHKIKNENDLKALKKDVYTDINKILYLEQDLGDYLANYFRRQKFDNDFNIQIKINKLKLTDFETSLDVYEMTGTGNREDSTASSSLFSMSDSRILVKRYYIVRNYYALYFDYYIDVSNKKFLVMRESTASLLMSIFTIVVVVIIFLITYRNLMEEKRLSNLKTDFINNMTHELKTPLSTITVAGKTLEMPLIRANDDKILETAKLIGKQSVHLNQLINLILEISMWERTQFQLDKKTVDIGELLNDIVESFRTGCGNCASVTQKYSLEGVSADIDVVYFTTMINNLLSNAVKYSDKEPEINVEGFCDREKIYIKVGDNGVGIDKNHQKHVFDKFYRVTSGNIHKTKGLGLGLYYVKRIAESHGGDVTVSSKPGKGSIFTVTIPNK
ncbi:MAG: HAMP domain-containing sensor histidine kinase [Bacteroidales bacterium]